VAIVSLSKLVNVADSGTFSYTNPRTIHWGAGSLADRLDEALQQRHAARVFVVTTRSVATNPAWGRRL
jgi:hypothetical protein